MLSDPAQDIGQPGLRIDVVQLGGDDERIHCRGALSAAIGSCEQPRLSAEGDATQRAFSRVVAEVHSKSD